MNTIHFFKEGIHFRLQHQEQVRQWVSAVVRYHKHRLDEINFIFCGDQYLLHLNKKFLDHDYLTDVITFENSLEKKKISGDIYISYDRVTVNAKQYRTSLKDELHRVMVHGVLHLLGYMDKSANEKALIRKAEDVWLGKRKF